jgi:HAMP domain-containing protein
MKIRTRLLVFLLPTIILSNLLIASLLSYHWYKEIYNNFQTHLTSNLTYLTSQVQKESSLSDEFWSESQRKKLAEPLLEPSKQLKSESHLSLSLIQILPSDPVKNLSISLPQQEESVSFQRKILSLNHGPLNETTSVYDFKSSEHLPYFTKKVHITPIYESKQGQKIMSGYAPIFDKTGNVIALLSADASAAPISEKLQEKLLLIALSTGLTIALVVIFLWVVASKISRPVQKLGGSALAIAAGQYGNKVQVKGPKEIVELANTLNTMSECLNENINRLKENSLLRERMYGEYECAMLLQHLILQRMIEECKSDAIAVKAITLFSENPRGLLLDLPKTEKNPLLQIHLVEAKETGFEGIYELLTQYKLSKETASKELDEMFPSIQVSIDTQKPSFIYSSNRFTMPIVWSMKTNSIVENLHGEIELQSGDFFFLFNQTCLKLCGNHKKIQDLVSKILKYFAEEGLDTCVNMLQKELAFLVKKKDPEEDVHLICFQMLI